MDSKPESQAGLPLGDAPHSVVPGSSPLRDARREAYAHARALGRTPVAAAREAGFTASGSEADPTAGLRGVGSKLERNDKVSERIRYLQGDTVERRRRQVELLDGVYTRVIGNSIADFVQINERGAIVADFSRIADLSDDERREVLSVVKTVRPTKYGTVIELYSPLDAAAQYRALHGLDAPKQVELGGMDGKPIDVNFVQQLDRAFRAVSGE